MLEPNNIYLGDCYELIKEIPDKSIDMVYIDIPYEFATGGNSGAFGVNNRPYNQDLLLHDGKKQKLIDWANDLYQVMQENPSGSDEYLKASIQRNKLLTDIETFDIQSGIDYSILDELCRVMKNIYIYIYGVPNHRYHTL